jgi:hypothetical protein
LKYLLDTTDFDYFVLLNIFGILNITITNSTIVIVKPKNNDHLNTNEVLFNYLVYNYTGKCFSIVDGKIINTTNIFANGNVTFSMNLSPGEHNWFVICGNYTTNLTSFYITVPKIDIVSPDLKEPEGDILFYIKVDSIDNTTSYLELYDTKGNLVLNTSFYQILYDYVDLNKGSYVLKVVAKNNYSISSKTLNFSVFTYSGNYVANVPENRLYVLIVLALMLIYIINYKNKKGD